MPRKRVITPATLRAYAHPCCWCRNAVVRTSILPSSTRGTFPCTEQPYAPRGEHRHEEAMPRQHSTDQGGYNTVSRHAPYQQPLRENTTSGRTMTGIVGHSVPAGTAKSTAALGRHTGIGHTGSPNLSTSAGAGALRTKSEISSGRRWRTSVTSRCVPNRGYCMRPCNPYTKARGKTRRPTHQ
jgi:hypothetical protein